MAFGLLRAAEYVLYVVYTTVYIFNGPPAMTNGSLPRTMAMHEARADLLGPPHPNNCFASADISVRSSRNFFVTMKIHIYRFKVSHKDLIDFKETITRWRLGNLHS